MNTPDQGPKDGDFVAYIEQLERRQMRPGTAAAPQPSVASPLHKPMQTTAATSLPNAASLPAVATALKALPVGLAAVGLVLLIAGAMFNGGIFLIALGLVLLWQAGRAALRSARAATDLGKSQAAQQVAALLATHAQRKKPQNK
jgi:hypothetical protein